MTELREKMLFKLQLRMLFYSDCTLKRYSEIKGISYITAVRRKNKIFEKLRLMFSKDE